MYDIFLLFIKHSLINVTLFLLSVSLSSFIIITLSYYFGYFNCPCFLEVFLHFFLDEM